MDKVTIKADRNHTPSRRVERRTETGRLIVFFLDERD